MNYTKNYHLPQWVKEDRIMMEDFNRMCADMEAGLNKTAADAAAETAKARADAASALAAVRTEAAGAAANAQASADAAQASADAARAVADAAFCSDYMPYVIGSYTGSGSTTEATRITLGFRPRLVIISSQSIVLRNESVKGVCVVGSGNSVIGFSFQDDGFSVRNINDYHPELNNTKTYSYIAFR